MTTSDAGRAFVHLSDAEASRRAIPRRFLVKSIRNGRRVVGAVFSKDDWRALNRAGERNLLLRIRPSDEVVDRATLAYLSMGRRAGVTKGYKCRVRDPWYAVPHVYVGDAFLTYMSGTKPKLFLNSARAVAPNTLHVVRMRRDATATGSQLVASWYSTLTALSCEIQGHSLGGGL